jgi:hypothetical protein
MQTQNGNGNGNSIEVRGPGGLWPKLTGAQVFNTLLLIVLAAVVVYMIDQTDQKTAARQVDVVAAMHALKEAVDRQSQMQQAFIYVSSLPQAEREKLNFAKPRALYNMQNYDREHRR